MQRKMEPFIRHTCFHRNPEIMQIPFRRKLPVRPDIEIERNFLDRQTVRGIDRDDKMADHPIIFPRPDIRDLRIDIKSRLHLKRSRQTHLEAAGLDVGETAATESVTKMRLQFDGSLGIGRDGTN